MEINAKIDMFLSGEGLEIAIHCESSGCVLFRGNLSPEKTCAALKGLAHVEMENANFYNADRIGKKMEMDKLSFEMPDNIGYGGDRQETAKELAKQKCPDGWTPDLYFNSQGSFSTKDSKLFAHTTIRRWI